MLVYTSVHADNNLRINSRCRQTSVQFGRKSGRVGRWKPHGRRGMSADATELGPFFISGGGDPLRDSTLRALAIEIDVGT
jgi:hypothetical protein